MPEPQADPNLLERIRLARRSLRRPFKLTHSLPEDVQVLFSNYPVGNGDDNGTYFIGLL